MNRTTIITAVCTFFVFFILLQDLRKGSRTDITHSRFIYDIDREAVSNITIIKNGEKHVSATKISERKWRLTFPLESPASEASISSIVTFINASMYENIITRNGTPDFDLKNYGLDKPPFEITFTAHHKIYNFTVSPVINNHLYIQRKDKPDIVYVTYPHFYNYFNKNVNDYRPRTILDFNSINLIALELSNENGFRITKPSPNIWMMERPYSWTAAEDIAGNYVKTLKTITIKDFISEKPSQEDLASYGLDKSTAVITITLQNQKPISLFFGNKDSTGTARFFKDSRTGNAVYTTNEAILTQLLKPDINLLRSHMLATFNEKQVNQIEVSDLRKEVLQRIILKKSNNNIWSCIKPANTTVGTERISSFLKTFLATRILKFELEGTKNIQTIGLTQPEIMIRFSGTDLSGKTGTIYTLNLINLSGEVYGYIEGTDSVLRIPSTLYTTLASGLVAFKSLYITHNKQNPISWFSIEGPNRVRLECKLDTERHRWDIVEPTGK